MSVDVKFNKIFGCLAFFSLRSCMHLKFLFSVFSVVCSIFSLFIFISYILFFWLLAVGVCVFRWALAIRTLWTDTLLFFSTETHNTKINFISGKQYKYKCVVATDSSPMKFNSMNRNTVLTYSGVDTGWTRERCAFLLCMQSVCLCECRFEISS